MEDWKFYPQNLFPDDWTPDRVEKSGLLPAYDHTELCTVHELDMSVDGENKQYSTTHTNGDEELMSTCWSWLQAPVSSLQDVAMCSEESEIATRLCSGNFC